MFIAVRCAWFCSAPGKIIIAAALFLGGVSANATTYEYDANGRLSSATNSLGDKAIYDYDSRGNLLRITRVGGGTLSLSAVSPGYGPPGVEVILQGTGFSTTPANNDVEFDGTAAAVLSATATKLVVQVPVGATDGPISVTVGVNTVSSAADFDVTDIGLPPVISSFTPTSGSPGTSVTLTGTNLEPYPGQTAVEINGLFLPVTSVSDVSISFTIPAWVGSGPVTVTTPFGRTASATPLTVIPAGVTYANVTSYFQLTTASSISASLASSGKMTAITFDAEEGDYISLQLSSVSGANLVYYLYSTTSTLLQTSSMGATIPTAHFPRLTRTGTYTLLILATGSASFDATIEEAPYITIGGSSVTASTTVARQGKRLVMNGTAGQHLGIGLSSFSGAASVFTYYVIYPSGGSSSFSCSSSSGLCDIDVDLPESGIYQLATTSSTATGAMSFVTTASEDLGSSFSVGTPASISLPRNGQNARYTFSGTAGENAVVQFYNIATTPSSKDINLWVLKPDGTVYRSVFAASIGSLVLPSLPVTGTYTAMFDPYRGETATLSAQLLKGSSYELTADGSSLSQSTSNNWRPMYFYFSGTAGEKLGLGFSSTSLSSGSNLHFVITRPNGNSMYNTSSCAVSTGCDAGTALVNLPETGTYAVSVDPIGAATMGYTATLSHEQTGSLTANTPASVSVSRRGQNLRYTFSGTAGTAAAIEVYGISTTPSSKSVSFYIYKPDGTQWFTRNATDSYALAMWNLPATGTYTVFASPDVGATASMNLNNASGSAIDVAVDGSTKNTTTSVGGHQPFITFSGTAGENLGIYLGGSVSAGTIIDYTIGRPDSSSALTTFACTATACDVDLQNLPATGPYSITMKTRTAGATMNVDTVVSHEVTGTLTTGVSQGISMTRKGQDARYTFSGTSGTSPSLAISSISTTPGSKSVSFKVLKPDGTTWKTAASASGTTILLTSMPATGTYTLVADPDVGATASFNALLQ